MFQGKSNIGLSLKRTKISEDVFRLPRQTMQAGFVLGKEDNDGMWETGC